jgi:1,4-alpha-glucan branching enzyme
MTQIRSLSNIMDRAPLLVSPYDAELFGHWWYEGPEFLDYFVRKAIYDQKVMQLTTPWEFLRRNPTQQVAKPSPSSWGEEGYWKVWLNENNHWIYPHLDVAAARMEELTSGADLAAGPPLIARALKQAGRELLLAQSSDWPFIMRTGTSPDYARQRIKDHVLRFTQLYEQLKTRRIDEHFLAFLESADNLFPDINPRYWSLK